MCQVHTGAYVSLLAPGITDYTACHPRKTTTCTLHVVPITTHTHDRRKLIGKKRKEEKKEDKGKERKGKKSKKRKKEGKEKKRQEKQGKTKQGEKTRKGRENKNVILADPRI